MKSIDFFERLVSIAKNAPKEGIEVKFKFKEGDSTPFVVFEVSRDDENEETEASASRYSINLTTSEEGYEDEDGLRSDLLWAVGCWVGGLPWQMWSRDEEQVINMMFSRLIEKNEIDEHFFKNMFCKPLKINYKKVRKEAEERVNHFLNEMSDFVEVAA